jgi:hypothetical protein
MASPHAGVYAIRVVDGFSTPPGVSKGNGPQFYHAKKPESSDSAAADEFPPFPLQKYEKWIRLFFGINGCPSQPPLDSGSDQTYNTFSPKNLYLSSQDLEQQK